MNNRIENNYVSEKQLRQLNQSRVEAKIVVLKAVGYPLESSFIETPEIEVTNKELFEIYAQDQWSGYKVHKGQYIFDQKLIPDFAFQVVDVRPDNSYITHNTSFLMFKQDSKIKQTLSKHEYKVSDVVGQTKAKNKAKIITNYLENPDKFKNWAPRNILFYGRQGHTGTADYSAILQEAGYTRNGAWYMFLYGGEYIPFAVIIGIMVILLAFTIYNIVKIGHNDVYSYMNKLKEDNENISKELGAYRTYMEKRSRQLQDFTENIAHQIKTPLTALSLSLDMMEEQLNVNMSQLQINSDISGEKSEVETGKGFTDTGLSNNEKLINNLNECFRQTYRIRDFITRLLKLSRMESGKIVLTEDDINVNEFINEVISEVPVVNNCNITSYCNDEYYFINADEEWLLEAFINIVQNCSEEAENVDINAVCNADKCIITIKDDGNGIAKDKLDNIFNRFESGKSYNSLHTGIGLNLSKLIIEAHHGSVSVNNNEDGRGVSFRIIIPKYNMKRKAK